MTDQLQPLPGEFLLYETEDGRARVECRFVADTLWLPQAGMAELFQTSKQNVAKHLKAIFAEGELRPEAVVNQWLITAAGSKAAESLPFSAHKGKGKGMEVKGQWPYPEKRKGHPQAEAALITRFPDGASLSM